MELQTGRKRSKRDILLELKHGENRGDKRESEENYEMGKGEKIREKFGGIKTWGSKRKFERN